jgi:hypothetical protein
MNDETILLTDTILQIDDTILYQIECIRRKNLFKELRGALQNTELYNTTTLTHVGLCRRVE